MNRSIKRPNKSQVPHKVPLRSTVKNVNFVA